MNNQTNWSKNILTWGLALVGLGIIVAVAGILLPGLVNGMSLPAGLVPGVSLFLMLLGIVSLGQYAFVRSHPKAGKQMWIDERDERTQFIRARAGQRAYSLSSALAFFLLIWATFAGDVGLPIMAGNVLWFSLLAVVVLPFVVYIGSITYEQNHK